MPHPYAVGDDEPASVALSREGRRIKELPGPCLEECPRGTSRKKMVFLALTVHVY